MEGPQDRGLVGQIGPVEIDWPRAIGYYGGIGLALAFEVVEPPLALFIASVPFLKMLNRPNSTLPARFVSQALDGAAKPVGGDGESSIRIVESDTPSPNGHRPAFLRRIGQEATGIWTEARQISRGSASPR